MHVRIRERRVLLLHPDQLFSEAVAARLAEDDWVVRHSWPTSDVEVAHALRVFRPSLVVSAVGSVTGTGQPFPPGLVPVPDVPVLAIVAPDDLRSAIRAIDLGVAGFITTNDSLSTATAAVDAGSRGEPIFAALELDKLRARLDREDQRRHDRMAGLMSLSPREAEVLADLVQGLTPQRVGRRRGIVVSTVRSHIKRILAKLGVSSQIEAVAHARQMGWRSPRDRWATQD